MTPRPKMSERLAPQGAGAVYGTLPEKPGLSPASGKGQRWDEANTRATFHLPLELQRAVAEEATRSGRSKSQVVADALREHLSR